MCAPADKRASRCQTRPMTKLINDAADVIAESLLGVVDQLLHGASLAPGRTLVSGCAHAFTQHRFRCASVTVTRNSAPRLAHRARVQEKGRSATTDTLAR